MTNKNQSPTGESYISKSFNSIHKELVVSEAFIPSLTGKTLLKLNECMLDRLGFYRRLHDEHNIELPQMDKVIHYDIDSAQFKRRFAPKQLQMKDIIECLPLSRIHVGSLRVNLKISETLINFFSKHFSTNSSFAPQDLILLKKRKFIWTQDNKNVSLECLPLLYSGQLKLPPSLPCSIHLVHKKLAKSTEINWLREHGVRDLDFVSFINKIDLLDSILKDTQKNICLIQFLFGFYYLSSSEHRKELQKLKGILLVSDTEEHRKSKYLYLSKKFKPSKLNECIPYDAKSSFFVNETYFRQGDNPEEWTKFLSDLGVNKDYEFITGILRLDDMESIPLAFMQEYRQSITSPLKGNARDEHTMTTFIASPYVEFLASKNNAMRTQFNQLFWRTLEQYQEEILKAYSSTTCVAPTKKQPQEFTYFQYVFRKQKLIKHENTLVQTSKLYAASIFRHLSKKLASKASNKFLEKYVIKRIIQNVVQLPVTLSTKMAKFLGFQATLTLADCIEQLKELQKNYNLDVYKWVLRNILRKIKASRETLTPLKASEIKIQLEANDNSWQNPSDLRLWAVRHSDGAPSDPFWIKDVLDDEEMHALCDFFDIDLYKTCLVDDSVPEAPEFEAEIKNNIPAIAYFLAKLHRNTPREALRLILPKFDELKFFKVSEEDLGAPIGRKNHHIYIAEIDGNFSAIFEEIGQFLGLSDKEIKAITRPFRRTFTEDFKKSFIPFQEEYTEYLKNPKDPSWHADDEDITQISEEPSEKSLIEEPQEFNTNQVNVPKMPPVTPPTTPVKNTTSPTSTSTPTSTQPKTPKVKATILEWQPEVSPDKVSLCIPGQMCPNSPPPKLPKTENTTSTPPHHQKESKDFDTEGSVGSEGEEGGLSDLLESGNLTHQNQPQENPPQEPSEADKANAKFRAENNQKVGKWGEEVVFRTAVFEYETKGYKQQQHPKLWIKKLCNQQGSTVEIEWMNHPKRLIEIPSKHPNDSGKPYDIKIIEIETKTIKFIEVKSTRETDNHFSLSANEISKFFRKKELYCIYNVISSGKEKPTIEKCSYQDFLNYISDGRLKPYEGDLKFKGKRPKTSHAEGQ